MADDDVISSLLSAIAAAPDDLVLRVHVARLLVDAGRHDEAIEHASFVLARDPHHEDARSVMRRAVAEPPVERAVPAEPAEPAEPVAESEFDWDAAESEVADIVQPAFVDDAPDATPDATPPEHDTLRPTVTLADVGGLEHVKERIEMSFLGPMRQPELRRLFGKELRGGLLLYGPPGCGKSFLAEALAGELDTAWISVQLHDVLDMWVGASERNLHEIFETARAAAPCVLFIDELDAIGQRRTNLRNSGVRNTVNQLLVELDGATSENEGVYVIGATNHPWEVDPALRRSGRFGQMVLVPPPDEPARVAILRTHLEDRPVDGIDLAKAAKRTDGFSGADLAQVCERAAERALADSVRSGVVRMITMADVGAAIDEMRPSTAAWFEVARNVVEFSNEGGEYDDLAAYMKRMPRR
jgi:SpoVK/Ycf46/Vps4 family AAA+-type ATPase